MSEQGEIQLIECNKVEAPSPLLLRNLPKGYSTYAITGEWSVQPDHVVKIMMVLDDRFELNPQEIEVRASDILADWIDQFQAGDIKFEELFTKAER